MLLVVDVGNTNTVLGLFAGETLRHHFRLATRREATSDEIGDAALSLLERHGVKPGDVTGAILASVVPPVNRATLEALKRYLGVTPLVVGPGLKTGMPILTDQPAEVGADRIVNAVAAFAKHKVPLIVVDFGTATTFDAVNAKGEYLGGAIAPGIDVSMDALFVRAAKLPRIEITEPQRVIGRNTVTALQAGLFYGYVGLVDELGGTADRGDPHMIGALDVHRQRGIPLGVGNVQNWPPRIDRGAVDQRVHSPQHVGDLSESRFAGGPSPDVTLRLHMGDARQTCRFQSCICGSQVDDPDPPCPLFDTQPCK